MPRYRLTVAYDGADFHGWQKQTVDDDDPRAVDNDSPPGVSWEPMPAQLRTVQHVLEKAVRFVVREPVNVLGASRTDSGVHARAQTAAFTCSEESKRPPDDRLALAINARLPADVLVTKAEQTSDEFDPIRDCVEKGYRYTIATGLQRPLWDRRTVAHLRYEMEIERMQAGAQHIVGTHDFACFAAAGHGRESTVRTVTGCSVTTPDENRIAIDISGDGFLYNMVRIVAGTLMDVGRGRIESGDVPAIIESRERRNAGPTLPPEGLCLMWMRYPGDPVRTADAG